MTQRPGIGTIVTMTAFRTFAPPAAWLTEGSRLPDLIAAVGGTLVADPASVDLVSLSVRDTPDRRLARAGYRLECLQADAESETWCLLTTAGEPVDRAAVPVPVPKFADGLAPGTMRGILEGVCQGRSLAPDRRVEIAETTVALRDREGKIRCRITLKIATGAGSTATLTVAPLKGYDGDGKRIAARIKAQPGWREIPTGRQAPLPPSKLPKRAPRVQGTDPAGPVLRDILSEQLAIMQDRLPGVLSDTTPVFLHQFRVAIRRTRSALSQLSASIALEGRAAAVDGYRWLGQVTSPVRDLDVHLLDLETRRRHLGSDGQVLDTLERYLLDRKATAHRTLVRDLTGARYQALVAGWRDSLDPSNANWTATEALRAPFEQIVAARTAKLLNRVLKDGAAIHPETPADALHDLRKRMKKLRYVIEFLREAIPRARLRPAIKSLKELQDVLGRIQDREVQVAALHAYGRAIAKRKSSSADALMAIGAWSEELDIDRRSARDAFAAAFARFADKETQALFHGIFAECGVEETGTVGRHRNAKET